MGLLTDGVALLNETLDTECGVSLTYSRGGVSATLTGSVGQTNFETDSEFGILRIESRDFLITRSRLTAAGFGEPKRGDRITETQGSDTVTHEVLEQAGIPPFSYSDFGRTRLRIHTKRVTVT